MVDETHVCIYGRESFGWEQSTTSYLGIHSFSFKFFICECVSKCNVGVVPN
jgi:hypothetical protein